MFFVLFTVLCWCESYYILLSSLDYITNNGFGLFTLLGMYLL
jgi:hypothetical protein